jgi:methionyl-tRNA formyltransferase
MQIVAPAIKTWCELKGVPVTQPESLRELPSDSPIVSQSYDLAIVASYGKIIPDAILEKMPHGTLNVHPSLLPLYRGPSPIESALLDGVPQTGVSIIKLDSEMDHGPILTQTAFTIDPSATAGTLEVSCGLLGGELLVQVLPHYLDGTLIPREQDHGKATICKKIEKEMGHITLKTPADEVRRKFRALTPWPGLFFFINHQGRDFRVKVKEVDMISITEEIDTAEDIILDVIPEGKSAMDWESFQNGYLKQDEE